MVDELPRLTGPMFEPARTETVKYVVLMLHGYGANGDDLIGLAPQLSAVLPNTLFLAPNAPFQCGGNPFGGYQWFDVWEKENKQRLQEIRLAEKIINKFIDCQMERSGINESNLFFLGFSQGTMLSLHVALRRQNACAGVLGFSGRLEAPDLLNEEIKSRPPVLLVHGERDEVLPIDMMFAAESKLKQNNVDVNTLTRPELGHGIDEEGLQCGIRFFSQNIQGGLENAN